MNQLSIVTALALAFAASAASADDKVRANLRGFQEVPVVSTPASGTLRAEINRSGTEIDYELNYSNMQAPVTQAHIHIGQRKVNGGIVLWFCGSNIIIPPATTPTRGPEGTPLCTDTNGHFAGTFTAAHVQAIGTQQIPTGQAGLDEVIDAIRAGFAYANVHTTASPGGEIRGQLKTRDDRDDDDDGGGDHKH